MNGCKKVVWKGAILSLDFVWKSYVFFTKLLPCKNGKLCVSWNQTSQTDKRCKIYFAYNMTKRLHWGSEKVRLLSLPECDSGVWDCTRLALTAIGCSLVPRRRCVSSAKSGKQGVRRSMFTCRLHPIFRVPQAPRSNKRGTIALFTVTFAHLHYNKI